MTSKSHEKRALCKQNEIMHLSSYQQFWYGKVARKDNKLNNKVQVSVIV